MTDRSQKDETVPEDIDDAHHSVVRAKWAFDGATTLTEAAAMLRTFADNLEALEAAGWQLTVVVNDDYGFIERTQTRP